VPEPLPVESLGVEDVSSPVVVVVVDESFVVVVD
jgi:hypothetical protein